MEALLQIVALSLVLHFVQGDTFVEVDYIPSKLRTPKTPEDISCNTISFPPKDSSVSMTKDLTGKTLAENPLRIMAYAFTEKNKCLGDLTIPAKETVCFYFLKESIYDKDSNGEFPRNSCTNSYFHISVEKEEKKICNGKGQAFMVCSKPDPNEDGPRTVKVELVAGNSNMNWNEMVYLNIGLYDPTRKVELIVQDLDKKGLSKASITVKDKTGNVLKDGETVEDGKFMLEDVNLGDELTVEYVLEPDHAKQVKTFKVGEKEDNSQDNDDGKTFTKYLLLKKTNLELSFKVEDQEGKPINGATIKIKKINEDGSMEDVTISDEGVVEGKYKVGDTFKVLEVSKDGYDLVTDLTQQIIIDARQSENIIPLVMSIELFKLKFMVQDNDGKALANAKIKITNDKDEVVEELTTLLPPTETSKMYAVGNKLKVEVSLDGYITAKKDVTVSEKESERSVPIKMTKETFELTFKVTDEDKVALQDVTIKIKDDKGMIVPLNPTKTNAEGEVKTKEKYPAGTKLTVEEVSKEGYVLADGTTKEITVSSIESERTIPLQLNIKTVLFKVIIKNSEGQTLGAGATVKVEVINSKIEVTTTTGEDSTTLNDNTKFVVGSVVTITVTKDGYFAKKSSYTFEDKPGPQELIVSLTKEVFGEILNCRKQDNNLGWTSYNLKTIPGESTEDFCQTSCKLNPDCDYYVFVKETKKCWCGQYSKSSPTVDLNELPALVTLKYKKDEVSMKKIKAQFEESQNKLTLPMLGSYIAKSGMSGLPIDHSMTNYCGMKCLLSCDNACDSYIEKDGECTLFSQTKTDWKSTPFAISYDLPKVSLDGDTKIMSLKKTKSVLKTYGQEYLDKVDPKMKKCDQNDQVYTVLERLEIVKLAQGEGCTFMFLNEESDKLVTMALRKGLKLPKGAKGAVKSSTDDLILCQLNQDVEEMFELKEDWTDCQWTAPLVTITIVNEGTGEIEAQPDKAELQKVAPFSAKCEFDGGKGYVFIREKPYAFTTEMFGEISGLTDGLHGFHIHEKGELGNGCEDAGDGFLDENGAYLGNLGSVSSSNGKALVKIQKREIKLSGPEEKSVLNRAMVVHEDPTGGPRVMCCKIKKEDCTIAKTKWMYQGADNQNDKWPQNCASCDASLEGNDRQSPIDLNPKLTNMETKTLPKLTFNPNPNGDTLGKFENKVNTIQFTANDLTQNTMSGGPLNGEYSFWQMHCHWGKTDYKPGSTEPTKVEEPGSEHWINGKQYDAECHWVHFNNKYGTVEDAIKSGDHDALSVVGVMLEIDATNGQDEVEWIGTVKNAAAGLVTPSDGPAKDVPFNVYGFLKQLGDQNQCFGYYNYLGGLTTPGCNQLVSFIIIDTPIKINLAQWANVYKLQADNAIPVPQVMINNFRLPQNVDKNGALMGAKRDVTKYVCP